MACSKLNMDKDAQNHNIEVIQFMVDIDRIYEKPFLKLATGDAIKDLGLKQLNLLNGLWKIVVLILYLE